MGASYLAASLAHGRPVPPGPVGEDVPVGRHRALHAVTGLAAVGAAAIAG